MINTIDWTGGSVQSVVAKERHKAGGVGFFDGVSGQFNRRIEVNADRLFVADVAGDWREELIVLDGNNLKIYHNSEKNQNSARQQRLWQSSYYQRSKMNYNYYSP